MDGNADRPFDVPMLLPEAGADLGAVYHPTPVPHTHRLVAVWPLYWYGVGGRMGPYNAANACLRGAA